MYGKEGNEPWVSANNKQVENPDLERDVGLGDVRDCGGRVGMMLSHGPINPVGCSVQEQAALEAWGL